MDKPLVSIIINNYNYGRFLPEAIESALSQTYPNVEVIVVDDGSTDGSRAVIESYGSRIVPILKENGGQASAFNAGFAVARGDLIHFLDADDVVLPECIQRVVDAVAGRSDQVAKVHFRLQFVDIAGRKIDLLIPSREQPLPQGDLRPQLVASGKADFPATSGNVFTRRAMEKIMPIPPGLFRLCADNYVCRLVPLFGEVVAIDEPLVLYRAHGGNAHATEGKALDDEELDRVLASRSTMFYGVWHSYQRYAALFDRNVPAKFKTLYLMCETARAVVRRGRGTQTPRRLARQATSLMAFNPAVAWHKRLMGMTWLWSVALLPHGPAVSLIKRAYGLSSGPGPAPASSPPESAKLATQV